MQEKGLLQVMIQFGYKMGKTYGIGKLTDKFNIILGRWPGMNNPSGTEVTNNKAWAYGSTKVKITKKGFLTQFPWNLGPVRNTIKYSICTYYFKCSKRK